MSESATPNPQQDDPFADVFRRARDGDQDAATDIVNCYSTGLRHWIRIRFSKMEHERELRQKFDSVDILQEAWFQLWKNAYKKGLIFEQPAALIVFLQRVAEYKLLQSNRAYFGTDKRNLGCEVSGMAIEDMQLPHLPQTTFPEGCVEETE